MRAINSIKEKMKQELSDTKTLVEFGTFCVESGELVLSDPCYVLDVWCLKKVDGVKNGTGNSMVFNQMRASLANGSARFTRFMQTRRMSVWIWKTLMIWALTAASLASSIWIFTVMTASFQMTSCRKMILRGEKTAANFMEPAVI